MAHHHHPCFWEDLGMSELRHRLVSIRIHFQLGQLPSCECSWKRPVTEYPFPDKYMLHTRQSQVFRENVYQEKSLCGFQRFCTKTPFFSFHFHNLRSAVTETVFHVNRDFCCWDNQVLQQPARALPVSITFSSFVTFSLITKQMWKLRRSVSGRASVLAYQLNVTTGMLASHRARGSCPCSSISDPPPC